jgi:hypothetical protein
MMIQIFIVSFLFMAFALPSVSSRPALAYDSLAKPQIDNLTKPSRDRDTRVREENPEDHYDPYEDLARDRREREAEERREEERWREMRENNPVHDPYRNRFE